MIFSPQFYMAIAWAALLDPIRPSEFFGRTPPTSTVAGTAKRNNDGLEHDTEQSFALNNTQRSQKKQRRSSSAT